MKALWLFFLTYLHLSSTGEADASSLAAQAFSPTFMESFATDQLKLDIVCVGNTNRSKLAREIIKQTSKYFSMKVVSPEIGALWPLQLNSSSVLLFESAEQFREWGPRIKWLSNPSMRFKHVVYAPNLTATDIIESMKDGFKIDQVAFLMNDTRKTIDLVTSFMFTERACRKTQLKVINQFNGTTSGWKTKEFFPKKYKNMHNCSLSLIKSKIPNDSPEMFPALAKKLNFALQFLDVPVDLDDVLKGADLFDYSFTARLYPDRNDTPYILTTTTQSAKVLFFLPNGEPYTQLEKMFMMFDNDVWIGIGCTLIVLIVTIQVINRSSKKVQSFVFGRHVRTPTMNLMEIFLCGAQYKVPGRNFARYTLILVVFWSLVIRTCYQSKLFEFLQSDLRKPRIKTLQEVEELNFTILNDYRVDIRQRFDKTAIPSNKVGTIAPEWHFIYFMKEKYHSGVSSLHILEEISEILHFGTAFAPFCPFFNEFNEQIRRLVSGGFFNYWASVFMPYKHLKVKVSEIGPQVLTMDHMEVAFIASLLPLTLAMTTFIAEVSAHGMKILIPRIRAFSVIKTYYRLFRQH